MRSRSACAHMRAALILVGRGEGRFSNEAVLGWSSDQSLAGKEGAHATVVNAETNEGVGHDRAYFSTLEFTTADGQGLQNTPAVAPESVRGYPHRLQPSVDRAAETIRAGPMVAGA